jgi:hypothetical protein
MDWSADPELRKLRHEFIDSLGERSRKMTELRPRLGEPQCREELAEIVNKMD